MKRGSHSKKKKEPAEPTVSPPRTNQLIIRETPSAEQPLSPPSDERSLRSPGSPSTSGSNLPWPPSDKQSLRYLGSPSASGSNRPWSPPSEERSLCSSGSPSISLANAILSAWRRLRLSGASDNCAAVLDDWIERVAQLQGSPTGPPLPTLSSMEAFEAVLRLRLVEVRWKMWFGCLPDELLNWDRRKEDGEEIRRVCAMARSLVWMRLRDETEVEKTCPSDLIHMWVLDLKDKEDLVNKLKLAAAFASTIAGKAKKLGLLQRQGSKRQRVCELMVRCLFEASARILQELYKMRQEMPATQEPQGDDDDEKVDP